MFTIPDKTEGAPNFQSVWYEEYLDALVASMLPEPDGVLSGCDVTGGADMTPAVAKGAVLSGGVLRAVAAGTVTIAAADAALPRIDLIVANSSGAKAVRQGTPALKPRPPARSANDVLLRAVYVAAGATAVATGDTNDLRMPIRLPVTVHKETTARSQNNSAAAVSLFASPPVIPSGLFLAGRVLRVRMGGNVLHNTTTAMTVTLNVSYGGTTLFQDVGLSFGVTADADRQAWRLEFDIIASASNNQRLVGLFVAAGPTVAAPTTGIGDIATDELGGVSPLTSPAGGITVDSDAADRTLNVTFTMSAANALHEWVREYATVELH